MIRLHEETGLPLVGTNDAHYLRKEDAEAHDVLLCIQTGKTLDDENRMRSRPRSSTSRPTAEMAPICSHGAGGALENTVKIAQLCNVEFSSASTTCPTSSCPEGWTTGPF